MKADASVLLQRLLALAHDILCFFMISITHTHTRTPILSSGCPTGDLSYSIRAAVYYIQGVPKFEPLPKCDWVKLKRKVVCHFVLIVMILE